MTRSARILPIIVAAQFAGTSVWFAANAAFADLQREWALSAADLGITTSAVQVGFITGTLCFTALALADRFSPRKVFFTCSICAATANLLVVRLPPGLSSVLISRTLTGFFLAGIYPVGMKIAAGWYRRRLGNALGLLVGSLVLGTAFPHLLKAAGRTLPWPAVMGTTSAVAIAGGLAMLLGVPDGPHLRGRAGLSLRDVAGILRVRPVRRAALAYFGHMWELYTLWAFAPVFIGAYAARQAVGANVSLWTFALIAAGSLGCILGGVAAPRVGSAPVAAVMLTVSGLCCLVAPLCFEAAPALFLLFILVWGFSAAGDSPQFSALVARGAPPERVGSALTLVNCLGFALCVVSIEVTSALTAVLPPRWLLLHLAAGPALGLAALGPAVSPHPPSRSRRSSKRFPNPDTGAV